MVQNTLYGIINNAYAGPIFKNNTINFNNARRITVDADRWIISIQYWDGRVEDYAFGTTLFGGGFAGNANNGTGSNVQFNMNT